MKIIILGAGKVGATLAEQLATEHNDITLIDINEERLKSLQDLDILTIIGHGAYPSTLRRGGAEEADMLIAVTSSDETNLVACQIAYTLFQIPTKIARIRSVQYTAHEELFGAATAFPVDVLISPEQLVSYYIRRLIDYPNALQVLDFADKKVQMVAIKTKPNSGRLVGAPLKMLSQHLPYVAAKVVAIFRNEVPLMLSGNTIVEPEDEVFFLAAPEDVRTVMSEFIHIESANKKIMIAGGGNIGAQLATTLELEDVFQITVIEKNNPRVNVLETQLSNTRILHGDASDKTLLLDENIEEIDVFCAVTNSDETNIMSSILAKHLGARTVMTLIGKPSYIEVIEGCGIDIAISPQQATISSLLTHIRRGHIVNVHSLKKGTAEAMEVIVHGTHSSSKVVGRPIKDIPLPTEATIGALVRKNMLLMAHDDLVIESGDHVILFLTNNRKIRQIERLFQEEGGLITRT